MQNEKEVICSTESHSNPSTNPNTMKKALIVGIDPDTSTPAHSNSSAAAASKISNLLSRNEMVDNAAGERNFDCKELISSNTEDSEKITHAIVKEHVKELFEDDETDVAFFYFSGNSFDDNLGGYLLTQDLEAKKEGFALSDLMVYANNSKIKEIYIVLDCYAERAKVKAQTQTSSAQFAVLRKGISLLSVKNYEPQRSTVFAELIVTALKGVNSNVLGNVTFIDLYEQANSILPELNYEIAFRSNTSRLSIIRKVIPKISHDVLMKIRDYFPTPHYNYPLDNEHIPSQNLGREDKQLDYKNLQRMHKQGLVRPVNAFHFYYAAFNKKHCALTERGKQYWELIEKQRI